ncbi:MAG: alpha/beta hydrolase [Alphaproteobacteria bacterium]
MKIAEFKSFSMFGWHRISYAEHGPEDAENVALCIHGLTGNGRGFDPIASQLAERGWRVICPDLTGRGKSDLAPDPKMYGFRHYMTDIAGLLAYLQVWKVHWIGTSMGGLLGMRMAALPDSPVQSLVLNDIGPMAHPHALNEIVSYLQAGSAYDYAAEYLAALKESAKGRDDLTEADHVRKAEHGLWPILNEAGEVSGYRPAFDPAIAQRFEQEPLGELDLWTEFDRIQARMLVLRGAMSDLLPREVVDQMTRRAKAPITAIEVPGAGHCPSLSTPGQMKLVCDWLETGQIHLPLRIEQPEEQAA